MSLRRMAAIVRKELIHVIRDPRNVFLVAFSPAFLLFLLAYIFSFDVTQLSLAALDLDRSSVSRRYLAELTNNQDLTLAETVDSYDAILGLLMKTDVDAAVVIPPGFADLVHSGRPAQVQAIIDGTDPIPAGQAMRSLEARSGAFVASTDALGFTQSAQPVETRAQVWYNAGLESLLSMVPGLLAIVLLMPTMALALALTRERETGTLEGLMATPLSGLEYLLGKLLAYIAAGLVSALLALIVAIFWFKVPFRGSLGVYLLLATDYLLACMGAAVIISNFARSQQTAMFIILIIFLVPSFFLAGLITPVSTESLGAMLTSYALPSTHFVEISRVIFLKGLGPAYLVRPALALFGMGIGAVLIGLWLFRKKIA